MTTATAQFPSPTVEQQLMIDELSAVFMSIGQWPCWAWLEETMEREDLDAGWVLASMPKAPHNYSFVWPVGWPGGPSPDAQMGLTVAGLHHAQGTRQLVDAFVRFVAALGTLRQSITLDPLGKTRPTVTKAEVVAISVPAPQFEAVILDMLSKEPATWNCQLSRGSSELVDPAHSVDPSLRGDGLG